VENRYEPLNKKVIKISETQPLPIKVYFENINAIRFIAASLVIVHHLEQFKSLLGVPNYWSNPSVYIIGRLGVILFFVLSGFLISYLLFKEQEVTATINIKNFYRRRILRIWPLYFLIVLAAFFIFPFINFFIIPGFEKDIVWHNIFFKLVLYALFLPNLALHVFGMIPYASQTWSIGAEEQFYLIWPFLNKTFKNKWFLMFGVIFTYLFVRFSITHFTSPNKYLFIFNEFWSSTSIDCMAIGGLFALIVYETTPFASFLRKILFHKTLQWSILLAVIVLISSGIRFSHLHDEIYAVLFGMLICNFAANKQRIFSMEYSGISYLGKVSYGMYMFHPIVIVFSIRLLQKFNFLNDFALYPLTFALVITLSTISYEIFEKRFLSKKIRYSQILSGD